MGKEVMTEQVTCAHTVFRSVWQFPVKMNEFGIVFNHHDVSAGALRNLQALRDLNPGIPIYPVSAGEAFAGGWKVQDLGEGGRIWTMLTRGIADLEWRNADWLSYAWILSGKARCRRWAFVEWDVYSTMPLREFLGQSWDQAIAGVEVYEPEKDAWWPHFRGAPEVPEVLMPYRRGIVPLCFYLASNDCASAIAELALRHQDWPVFSEFRLGTFATASGFEPSVIDGARKTISWRWEGWTIEGRGVWHPVKTAGNSPS